MPIPKHEPNGRKPRATKSPKPPQPASEATLVRLTGAGDLFLGKSIQHDINHVDGLSGVEVALDGLAGAVQRLTGEGHTVNLNLTLSGNDFDDTMERLVTAFERIADSLAKFAGLPGTKSRPSRCPECSHTNEDDEHCLGPWHSEGI